jgi:hypothetical protein
MLTVSRSHFGVLNEHILSGITSRYLEAAMNRLILFCSLTREVSS